MKGSVLIFFLLLQLCGIAQEKAITLFAFEQKIIPGIAQARDIDEKGNMDKVAQANNYQYFIYVSFPEAQTLQPVALWIKGEKYKVRTEAVAKVPVERAVDPVTGTQQKLTLVPFTTNRVLQLYPAEKIIRKNEKGERKHTQKELVLVFKTNGKMHCLSKASFQSLPPWPLP